MYGLAALAIVLGMLAFAFGERAARIATAAVLSAGALFVLFIVFIVIVDSQRQVYNKPHSVVRMGPAR